MSTAPTRLRIDRDVAEAVPAGASVLCVVAEPGDDELELAQRAAVELTVSRRGRLVLFDRSEETWGDTDHSGLVDVDEIDLTDAPELVAPLAAAQTAGIEVAVWRSTIPTIGSGILTATQDAGVDAVVVPAEGGTSSLADRVLEGGDSLAATLAALFATPVASDADAAVPIVVVGDDGRVSLAPSG